MNCLQNFLAPPAHKHKEYEHAWYVIEGELTVELDNIEMSILKGGFIFIPKRAVHCIFK